VIVPFVVVQLVGLVEEVLLMDGIAETVTVSGALLLSQLLVVFDWLT
jgi:hypothetical protein